MQQKLIFVFLILGIVVFFGPLLFLNFSQDDFYCLLISKADSIKDFVNFFTPEHSFITSHYNFYRPLSTQFYFGIMQKIFGLNPMQFHVFNLLIQIINTLLVYKLANIFVNNSKVAILASFFYGLNQSLLISVGYVSNVQILLATTFSFLTIIFYKKKLILSLIFLFWLCYQKRAQLQSRLFCY